MVAVASISDIDEDRPESFGVYYFDEVARYLSVGDADYYAKPFELKDSTVRGWAKSGYFPTSVNPFPLDRERRYISFGSLVTARVVALLRSYGVSGRKIREAHELLAERTGSDTPFVRRRFWTEAPRLAREVHAELDGMVVTASKSGQMPILELLDGPVRRACRMEFDEETDMPLRWHPSEGVTIDPLMASGSPCVAGTRTATRYLYESYLGGDGLEDLVDWYELSEAQVTQALDWEKQLWDVDQV